MWAKLLRLLHDRRVAEAGRILALSALAVYLFAPFLTHKAMGAGDANWYTCLLSDVVAQQRVGVFPVYVGQSQFSWNGFPQVQRAGLFLLAAAIDAVSWGRMSPVLLLHVVLAVTALAGALTMYWSLAAVAPARRGMAAVVAALYVLSPAYLWLPISSDSYPAFVCLPALPVLFCAIVRAYRTPDLRAALLGAAALAILWMSNPVIALWATALAALAAVLQLVLVRWSRQMLLCWLVQGAAFLVLSGWYFVAVATMGVDSVGPPGASDGRSALDPLDPTWVGVFVRGARVAIPAVFLPVRSGAAGLTDLQLGYALWALLALGLIGAMRKASPEQKALAVLAALVCLLLFPFPFATEFLWSWMPQIFSITNNPPLRLVPLLALLACFLGVLGLQRWPPLSWRGTLALATAALVAGGWGFSEANKFRARGFAVQHPSSPALALREENASMPRYAIPLASRHFSPHGDLGCFDPALDGRLLVDGNVVADNLAYLLDRTAPSDGVGGAAALHLESSLPLEAGRLQGVRDLARVRLQPGQRCLLTLRYRTRECLGVVWLTGPFFERVHALPASTAGLATLQLPLWTTHDGPVELLVRLVGDNRERPANADVAIASLSAAFYDRAELPVRITSLIPYEATVTASMACDLETHRLFVPGYTATVNGSAAPVTKSAEGLVAIPLSPGENRVQLLYTGTAPMRVAGWISLAGWLALIGLPLVRSLRHRAKLRRSACAFPAAWEQAA